MQVRGLPHKGCVEREREESVGEGISTSNLSRIWEEEGGGGGDLCHAVSQNKQLGIAKIEVIRSHAGKLAQQEIHTMVKVRLWTNVIIVLTDR